MLTRRDMAVATAAIAATCAVGAVAQQRAPIIGPSVYDWALMQPKKTETGEVTQIARGPTATLDELEMHVTKLNPGLASHPPHQHENEELVIIREGTVETLSGGEWKRLGPGSVIFNASNSLHALRNVGPGPAVYHVVNWKSPKRG